MEGDWSILESAAPATAMLEAPPELNVRRAAPDVIVIATSVPFLISGCNQRCNSPAIAKHRSDAAGSRQHAAHKPRSARRAAALATGAEQP